MAARDVYTMKEFLEVISLQEQTVFLDIKRRQRAAAAAGGSATSSVCSLEEVLDVMALQQKKATFEKKRQEKLAQPNLRRPSVIELFGELHYSEPLSPPAAPAPGKSVALRRRRGALIMAALVLPEEGTWEGVAIAEVEEDWNGRVGT